MVISKKTMLKSLVSTSVLISSLILANVSHAQQTGVADPAQAERRLTEERLIPQGGPNISIKKASLLKAPAGSDNITFNFGGLRVNGVSIYNDDELYALYNDKVGQTLTLTDLYGIANDLTLKYRNDGYILTQVAVPPQTISDGIADLQVVEGFIDNIDVQGGEAGSAALKEIQEFASLITNDKAPLNIHELERQLLLINDLPGVEARTIISPSASTRGAADMLIKIDRDPFDAIVSVDNHGSRFLGPIQFSGAAIFNSAFGMNEKITAQVAVAPDAGLELAFGSLQYEQPIGPYGTLLQLGGSVTETDPGFTLDQFDVEGLSRNFFIGVEHPIIRSRETNVFARTMFDWRNVDSKNNVTADIQDRIRAIRAGVKADFLDRLLGVAAVNSVDFEVSQGIDIWDASEEGDANLTRAAGDPTFLKAKLRVERLQRVTSNVNVLLSGRGQISNNPLLSSEEFGLGGYSTVRGYDPSEVVGDDGIAGNVEVQVNNAVKNVQLFGFVDAGTVWDQDATTSAGKRTSLVSTGLGLRIDLPMDVKAEFVAAQPLNRDIASQGERDPQFFFSLSKEF